MFYAIRPVMDEDGTETGTFYVTWGSDADAFADRATTKDYESVEAARQDFPPSLPWREPDEDATPDILLIAED